MERLQKNYLIIIFFIIYFPVIGNAISFHWFPPYLRTFTQLCILLFTIFYIIANSDFKNILHKIKANKLMKFQGSILVLGLGYSFVLLLFNGFGSAFWESAFKQFSFLIFLLSLMLLAWNPKVFQLPSGLKSNDIQRFNRLIFLIGLFIVMKAWFYTVLGNGGAVTLGGLYITTGYLSAIVYFFIIHLNRNFVSLIWSLPYLYLVVYATSRTGYVVFIFCFFLFLMSLILEKAKDKKLFIPILIVFSFAAFILVGSMKLKFFPYLIKEDSKVSRVNRVFRSRFPLLGRTINDIKFFSEISSVKNASSNRLVIYKKTLSMIGDRWWGHWPKKFVFFEHLMQDYVRYPHNLILESGYYFGIPFIVITLLLTIWIGFRVFFLSTMEVASIPVFGYLLAMQVTGTFYSYVSFFIIAIFTASKHWLWKK